MNSAMSLKVEKIRHGFPKTSKLRKISNYFFSNFRILYSVCLNKKEELEISCRKGVVYLDGIIPSEIEHQVLLRTLTDVMDFSSIVDRI